MGVGGTRKTHRIYQKPRHRRNRAKPHAQMTEPEAPNEEALLEKAKNAHGELHRAVASRVVGQERVVDLMLVALLARGHALLVGVPGLAKTLLVSTLSEALEPSIVSTWAIFQRMSAGV